MDSENFDQFKDQCLEQISSLQEEFMKLYDISCYERWSFDDDFGVFQFDSDDGRNLYFKYSSVGSFSENTNTWKWAWDNKNLKDSERKGMEKVRIHGEKHGFNGLTAGLVDADDYTGWSMTAISAKILNAIGVYRFKEDHLTFYFVFTGELTKTEYDKLKEEYVICRTHGASRAAFVCQHLNRETYTGFHEAFESNPLIDPDDDHQAWCDECERVRSQEGEWNDTSEAFAKIRLICDQCFFEIKRRNQPG
ncbi:MAG: DUF6882 domain-containing protein [Bacteroidota bacterium]